jgi:arginine decarboxylase
MAHPNRWTTNDSRELYRVDAWGGGFFRVSAQGTVDVAPSGPEGPSLDLYELVQELRRRDLGPPLLLRFPGIIQARVEALVTAFDRAIADEGYHGRYHAIYPIKVNQQRRVVETLLDLDDRHSLGLEAGSKPELLAALALADQSDSLLVLNGYKDAEFVETALLATKLGRNAILVVDRFGDLEIILKVADRLGISPRIGVRAKLDATAEGRWTETSGRGSKFGLDPEELVKLVDVLEERDMLAALKLLHFHVGSQISAIRGLKDAVQEAARVYVELYQLGAPLEFLDVGGGLGVDYDGSQSTKHSSMNYDLQEYANNVVFHVREMCDEKNVPHPDIVSESGRALAAHHSVLVLNVPDLDEGLTGSEPAPVSSKEHRVFHSLYETWQSVTEANVQECWHDANFAREEAIDLFAHSVLTLRQRARADALYRACCSRILSVARAMEQVPEELRGLERRFCDTYFGNFSVFQSAPDHWAVDHVFPVMPIHRLDEEPTRRGILADLTCDSDGQMDRFIGESEDKTVLELHPTDGKPYYLAVFLLGAYQEILGDLHNLFGDTSAVHVSLDPDGYAALDDIVANDSVSDVLGYVGFDRRDLMRRMRRAAERAVREGNLSVEESALFLRDYENGLSGTTYLEEDPADSREVEAVAVPASGRAPERAPVGD